MSRIDLKIRLDVTISLRPSDVSAAVRLCRSSAAKSFGAGRRLIVKAGGWCFTALAKKLDALLREGIE